MSESTLLSSIVVKQYGKNTINHWDKLNKLSNENKKLRAALERIRDCDFVITLPDRMDAVRAIAREALE